MGNKLCAPLLKRNYRNDDYPFNFRKDSHLLRLWAEVFSVHGEGDYMHWERVSEDVVPVNITCIEDSPSTVFQITAYNRHVEKIFDVKIIQPGTIICPATDCFAHWRDPLTHCEWGLNFSSASDAMRFCDCCSSPSQKYARKASSASSLRMSPPKRVRGKVSSISSPNSPVVHLRNFTGSLPYEEHKPAESPSRMKVTLHGPSDNSQSRDEQDQGATEANVYVHNLAPLRRGLIVPINQSHGETYTENTCAIRPYSHVLEGDGAPRIDPCIPGDNICKPPSSSSLYDNIENPNNQIIDGASPALLHTCNMPDPGEPGVNFDSRNPAFRHSFTGPIPSQLNQQQQLNLHVQQIKQHMQQMQVNSDKQTIHSLNIHANRTNPPSIPTERQGSLKRPDRHRPIPLELGSVSDTETSSVSHARTGVSNIRDNPSRFSHPIATSSTITRMESAFLNGQKNEADMKIIAQIIKKVPHAVVQDTQTTCSLMPPSYADATAPSDAGHKHDGKHLQVQVLTTGQSDSTSHNTSSSESPEWPAPPDPLTPQTPLNPSCAMLFDSDALHKMLQTLPDNVSNSIIFANDLSSIDDPGFHDAISSRTSSNTNITNTLSNRSSGFVSVSDQSTQLPHVDTPGRYYIAHDTQAIVIHTNTRITNAPTDMTKIVQSQLLQNVSLDDPADFHKDMNLRDSYPDSGVGGLSFDMSLTSNESWSKSTAQYQPGSEKALEPSQREASASSTDTGSGSGSQSSSRFREIFPEGAEVSQYLAPELSDDDDGEDHDDDDDSLSSLTTMTESQISQNRQAGAIRKAGSLTVKNWLTQRKRKLELAPKRNWKKYWVCLKGTTLLFFDDGKDDKLSEDRTPRHILGIESGLAQAVPEHPKRDNIFSLSTAFAEAYLFQAQNAAELQSWICAVHSACASSFARQHGKDNTLKLIKREIQRLDGSIDSDVKMRKMAELQLSVVSDSRSRQAIVKQIGQWEENLERLHVEQYRLRCYAASLQGSELPNPKVLLSNASKVTKTTLARLGVFTVSSFYALVCARSPILPSTSSSSLKQKKGSSSGSSKSSKHDNSIVRTPTENRTLCNSGDDAFAARLPPESGSAECLSRVALPNSQTVVICVDDQMTVQELLESVCCKRQLDSRNHFVRFKVAGSANSYSVPDRHSLISHESFDSIEVCQKSLYQVELLKGAGQNDFGFAVEAELAQDSDVDDELQVYVSYVQKMGVAECKGLLHGDEILVINNRVISDLDMVYIENLLLEADNVCLTVRSCRTQRPRSTFTQEHTDLYIDKLVCRPPPTQSHISDKTLGDLIVPAPNPPQTNGHSPLHQMSLKKRPENMAPDQIDTLLKTAEQVTAMCKDTTPTPTMEEIRDFTPLTNGQPLTEVQRLWKVITELIQTERTYVKDLDCLIERYLEPLKEETFLSTDDIEQLFGNIQEIVQFQRQFLMSLEEAVEAEKGRFAEDDKQFKRILFSLGGSFLYYANHFKVYSSFCASHSRSQKILNPEANVSLREFLRARNPKQQHSATLESYLIKPIQRILKYPLLLQQLCHLTEPNTEEHFHLTEALKGMEAVAEHINEMQKIYEEYGTVFDAHARLYKETHPHNKAVDLSVGELQMYGTVEWFNAIDVLTKIKKGTDLENTVFVFRMGIVFLCKEKLKRKKAKETIKSRNPAGDSLEMVHRYRTLIPVHELTIKCGHTPDTDNRHWWDMIHNRSETEGRPERLYRFYNNSGEAKNDFLRIIRNTIRDGVKRPPAPSILKSKPPLGDQRVDTLPRTQRHSQKKHSSKAHEMNRHSTYISSDGYHTIDCTNAQDPTTRTRSRTFTDMNSELEATESDQIGSVSGSYNPVVGNVPMDIPPASNVHYNTVVSQTNRSSPSSSNSNLSGSSHSGSAKLLQASSNPHSYSSSSSSTTVGPSSSSASGSGSQDPGAGSPIWKPRSEVHFFTDPQSIPHNTHRTEPQSSNLRASAYGDCSEIVYRNDSLVAQNDHTNLLEHNLRQCDTDC